MLEHIRDGLIALLAALSIGAAHGEVWVLDGVPLDPAPTLQEVLDSGNEATNILTVGGITYSDTYWDDVTVSSLSMRDVSGPGNEPTLAAFGTNGTFLYRFDVAGDYMIGSVQIPHQYASKSIIRPHIHLADATANATSTWTLACTYGRIGQPSTNYYRSTAVFSNTAAFTHSLVGFAGMVDTNNFGPSMVIHFQVTKVDGSSTVFLKDTDFHYQINKPGSPDTVPDDI